MSLKIIGNKRIELTADEYKMYEDIARSYTKPNFDGKQLFNDLFETDEFGIIVYLKPPTKMFSMEVIMFMQNVMVHQHLRRVYKEHSEAMNEIQEVVKEAKALLEGLKASK